MMMILKKGMIIRMTPIFRKNKEILELKKRVEDLELRCKALEATNTNIVNYFESITKRLEELIGYVPQMNKEEDDKEKAKLEQRNMYSYF